jgi:dihydroorotate dehydrogenase electron transfer subunit
VSFGRERLPVLSNERVAEGHFVIAFASRRIAREARPGQFVQILTEESDEPLLPRPFSFLDARPGAFRILYQVVGKGTAILARKRKGDALWVLGPLGRGFTPPRVSSAEVLLVGGGVGIPPLYHFAKERVRGRRASPKNIRVFLGARRKAFLHCEKDFRRLGVALHLATDDGSRGHKGFVTEILDDHLRSGERAALFTCGPTAMLRAVSGLALKYDLPCQVSVEEPMPCGFGACLGCAIKVRDGAGFRYAMSCCEGPVFDAREVLWE